MAKDLYAPAPDLAAIPRGRWADVLRPLDDRVRMRAAMALPDGTELREAAMALNVELLMEDFAPRPEPPPLVPDAPAPASRLRSQQVNIKLSVAEYRALTATAAEFGQRPATFARQLVVRGVRQVSER